MRAFGGYWSSLQSAFKFFGIDDSIHINDHGFIMAFCGFDDQDISQVALSWL